MTNNRKKRREKEMDDDDDGLSLSLAVHNKQTKMGEL
jgi:hypothetical protein